MSTASNDFVQIKGNFSYDTANVAYLLECNISNLQYIGHSEALLRIQCNTRQLHTKTLLNFPAAKHVNIHGNFFNDLKGTVLESCFRSHHSRKPHQSRLLYKFIAAARGIHESTGKLTRLHLVRTVLLWSQRNSL